MTPVKPMSAIDCAPPAGMNLIDREVDAGLAHVRGRPESRLRGRVDPTERVVGGEDLRAGAAADQLIAEHRPAPLHRPPAVVVERRERIEQEQAIAAHPPIRIAQVTDPVAVGGVGLTFVGHVRAVVADVTGRIAVLVVLVGVRIVGTVVDRVTHAVGVRVAGPTIDPRIDGARARVDRGGSVEAEHEVAARRAPQHHDRKPTHRSMIPAARS
jgi:hypothetical protein